MASMQGMDANARTGSATNQPSFVGIQVEGAAFAEATGDGSAVAVLRRIAEQIPLNAIMVFPGDDLRRSPRHGAGTSFSIPGRSEHERDLFDRLADSAQELGIRLIMGGGEQIWGYHPDFPGYSAIAQVDCYGRTHRESCVNHPEWRRLQLQAMEDTVASHPQLDGFMFMHERVGPLGALFTSAMLGTRDPFCFCPHCEAKGRARGIDPERAKTGFKALHRLVQDAAAGKPRPADGWFVSMWRLFMRYSEIFAWDQLWWDSIHDYRAALAGAARVVRGDQRRRAGEAADRPGCSEFKIGFHFQHAVSLLHFPWKAGDDPARVAEYADWLKPSVYPGCSGIRQARKVEQFGQSIFADLPRSLVNEVATWLNGRDPSTEPEPDLLEQRAFSPAWVEAEVARLRASCPQLPIYAGLGIGVPAGEQVETPDQVRAWTEACYRGGADGILLSRGYLEMRPELLAAAGEVLRGRLVGAAV